MSLPPPTLPAPKSAAAASPATEPTAQATPSTPVVPDPVSAPSAVAPPAPPIPTLDATTTTSPSPRKWTTVLGVAVVVVIVAAGAALAYDQWIAGDESPTPTEPTTSIPDGAVTEPAEPNTVDEQPSTPPILGPATVEVPADQPVIDSPPDAATDDQAVVPLEQPAAPPVQVPDQTVPDAPAPAPAPAEGAVEPAVPPAGPAEVPAPPIDDIDDITPTVGAPASGGLEQPARVGNAIDSATEVVDAVNDRLPDDELLDDVLGD